MERNKESATVGGPMSISFQLDVSLPMFGCEPAQHLIGNYLTHLSGKEASDHSQTEYRLVFNKETLKLGLDFKCNCIKSVNIAMVTNMSLHFGRD